MAEKSTTIYRQAEKHLFENKPEEALALLYSIAKANPDHFWARYKIGVALEKLKHPNRAFEVFKGFSWHCLKAGYPLLALVGIKKAISLQASFEGALDALADMYSLESERIQFDLALFEPPELDPEMLIEIDDTPLDKLVVAATHLAQDFSKARYPNELPSVPLFSLLTVEAFYPILEILQHKTYKSGETIVAQGEPCTSVFILANGEVDVTETRDGKPHSLARLTSGSVFGEMALITDAPRLASAITIRECEVLELRREDLELASEDLDDITWALAKFTRQRFVNHLLLTSPIFKPFSPDERHEILERFSSVGVPTDEVVIKEGTQASGLYLILGGEAEVTKSEGGSTMHLATLQEGAVFGEISLVKRTPTTATVKAIRGGEFLFLSYEDFHELMEERPEIKDALSNLSEERLEEQRQAIIETLGTSEDGLVIF